MDLNGTGSVDSSVSGTATLTVGQDNDPSPSFSGSIGDGAGTVALTKAGSGTQTLAGASTYSGVTTVNGGVLRITHGQALGNTSGETNVASTGALHLEGGIAVGAEPLNTHLLVSLSGDNSWAGDIQAINGAPLTFRADADKLTITGDVNATSSDNQAHTLNLTGNGNGEITGSISNSGTGIVPLNKTGSGTWILSGANTYPNATNVSSGTLLVNGANSGRDW
jgi:autotransporter-associated beta strand protein